MEQYVKLRVNPSTQEMECEIPLSAWDRFAHLVLPSIERFNRRIEDEQLPVIIDERSSESSSSSAPYNLESFGELLLHVTSDKDVDRVLLAGFFLQNRSATKDFSSQEVTALLREHGHSPSNTSAFISQNNATKKVFKVAGNRFRVSAQGVDYLKQILK
jgi:hypothetical protein